MAKYANHGSDRCAAILPKTPDQTRLIGRVWSEEGGAGPRPVCVRGHDLIDLTSLAPTVSDLLEILDLPQRIDALDGPVVCSLDDAIEQDLLLSPIDLQAIKASGVTFAESAIERVIEERAAGDPATADLLRADLAEALGGRIESIKPGSAEALAAKDLFRAAGLWSQYLEVAIGKDPEIFTKSQPMSSVGYGAKIGIRSDSEWNNPEPEVVIVLSSDERVVGATLGNDVNLRDIEGRSALLLGQAKDNNASCAIGPFIRLIDDQFTVDDLADLEVSLEIEGRDGFRCQGVNRMSQCSRTVAELVAAAMGEHHDFPDGVVLFLGTMFVPHEPRDPNTSGFTHKLGDLVRISSPELGCLENTVALTTDAARWSFGVRALYRTLSQRGVL
ncbi:fumarylacetoacetate hydrolase family protein [Croceicoccus sediminis]|uniref:fumarylacetoacetate hydrolase family protein n=1 Tax=Croceicoccus sediminis TaxID=2571150 RepID=UPI001182DB4B|nr:fumarylacetoacetate hydrolase family protein [Croceicoccus sediminis]